MIEILFGDSEAASMKEAKKTVLPGNAAEVICLCYMLDIGDLKKEVDSQYRKELIFSIYNQGQWGNEDGINQELDKDLQYAIDRYMQEMKRLVTYLEQGESIRIWYCDAPYSRCGLYYICHFLHYVLKKYDNNIHVVKLPEYIVREQCTVSYQNLGEVAPEEFCEFLSYEKTLSVKEVNLYAILWSELVSDNSPLRAMVNGKVIGVPEDFYDFLIFKKLTHRPVKECRLMGDILGCYPVGIWDWWYGKRIQHYIEAGKIKVLEDSEKPYARLICLA